MSNQKKQFLISPTSSSASRFYLQAQENPKRTDRNEIKEVDSDSNLSNASSSMREDFNSSDQTPDPDNFFCHFDTTPARRVTKKEVLLGQAEHLDLLGRKSYIKTENSKSRNMPESLLDLPTREKEPQIISQPSELLSPRPLKTSFRRKSCTCTCCGGSSALERKIQDLPGFPIPRNAKQVNPTIGNLDERGTMTNINLIRNKHENSSKLREKGYPKNGAAFKNLAFQQKNTLEGLTPTHVQKLGSPSNQKGESIARTMYLETKQHSIESKVEVDEKLPKMGKEVSYHGQHTLHHIDENSNKHETTAIAVENKNQIAHLLKKKMVKRKKGIEGHHNTKQLYYSNMRMETFFKTFNSVIPKLKLESLLKSRRSPLEKTEEVPQEYEEEKNMKSIKAKLGNITGKEAGNRPAIKKLSGMTGRNIKEQKNFQTVQNTSSSYVLTDRSRSLPLNKIPEGLKVNIKHSMDKGAILSPGRPQNQLEGKEKEMKQKRPKLKLKKLDISGGFVANNGSGIQSVRNSATTTPKGLTFKISESARIKSSAKNDWLIKNYNTKIVIKKD